MHKILLAEDDNDMRRFLVKALENAGFQVSSHDNGLSAYQRLREEPFEMLLTDIKIMFITGFAAVALNSDSEAPKNAKVLAKPVHLRELVSEVNKMLAA
jgi:two-component system cell cycle response regulator CpdR